MRTKVGGVYRVGRKAKLMRKEFEAKLLKVQRSSRVRVLKRLLVCLRTGSHKKGKYASCMGGAEEG